MLDCSAEAELEEILPATRAFQAPSAPGNAWRRLEMRCRMNWRLNLYKSGLDLIFARCGSIGWR